MHSKLPGRTKFSEPVSEKTDRLAELRIDRTDEPEEARRWPWIVAGVIIAIAVAGFLIQRILTGPVGVEIQTVSITETQSGGVSVLDASGYVVARRQATVSSKIAGKVLDVLIEEGMTVEKDQVVATLDGSTQPGIQKRSNIVVGTDGIWEAHNASGERYGKDRFKDIIRRHAIYSADEILFAVTDALKKFQGSAPLEDDVTLVVIKIDR